MKTRKQYQSHNIPHNPIFKRNILYIVCSIFVITLITYVCRFNIISESQNSITVLSQDIIRPIKGQLYIQNYALNSPRALSVTNYSTRIIINPINLKKTIEINKFENSDIAVILSSLFNLNVTETNNKLENEVLKKDTSYYIFINNLDSNLALEFKNLVNGGLYKGNDYSKYFINNWLTYEDIESRVYPNNDLAGPIIGYTSDNYWSLEDVIKESRCPKLVENNNKFQSSEYKVGLLGLEAKYCSELYGLNGFRSLKEPVNGKDIYLTLDYNLQLQAEKINQKILTDNSNSRGGPKNVTSVIVEVNSPIPNNNGRIVAMASSPTFNPNNYAKDYESKPNAFINYSTDVPYEAGSVIKPLFVSSLLNDYFVAKRDNPGGNCDTDNRLCVGPDWNFNDTCGGKRYTKENILIKNYNNNCFNGTLGLKEVLRDSVNTGIAELSKNTTTENLRNNFLDKLKFGNSSFLASNNESSGNIEAIKKSNGYNINNAYFGFGQGFTNTPIQLLQAYIPLVSNGDQYNLKLVDDKIETEKSKVFEPQTTQLVKNYMIATSNEGYRGIGEKLELSGYGNGTKTGTAQIARFDIIKDANGKEIKSWCGYDCNSEKGLYEHTLIGFAPANNPRFLVLIKVSEAKPYESTLTSANQVLKKPWIELMQYTLEYMQVPKEF
jgi:cell division protein FtsI/penicillin-binding protein 2